MAGKVEAPATNVRGRRNLRMNVKKIEKRRQFGLMSWKSD
jgi:hypothetical protein